MNLGEWGMNSVAAHSGPSKASDGHAHLTSTSGDDGVATAQWAVEWGRGLKTFLMAFLIWCELVKRYAFYSCNTWLLTHVVVNSCFTVFMWNQN